MAGNLLLYSSLAFLSNGPDTLSAFGTSNDKAIKHKFWNSPAKQWLPSQNGWENLGTGGSKTPPPFYFAPICCNCVKHALQTIMGCGSDGKFWYRPGKYNEWGNWENLGGSFNSPPSATFWNNSNSFTVTGIGKDSSMWTATTYDNVWTDWQSLGGTFKSPPTMTSWDTTQMAAAGVATNNGLYMRKLSSGVWQNWESLGGTFASSVQVISRGNGFMDVFGVGNDGVNMWHRGWSNSGGWGNWQNMGGTFASSPSVISWNNSHMDCFGKGTDGNTWHRSWTGSGGWGNWENLGGSCMGAPTTNSWESGQTNVGCTGKDNTMQWKKFEDGAWGNWEGCGGNFSQDGAKPLPTSLVPLPTSVPRVGADMAVKKVAGDSVWGTYEILP